MMQLSVTQIGGGQKSMDVSDAAFGREFNEALVHQVVVAHMAGKRQGTKRQKNRAEASGSTKKPWNQKGTGRARAGNIRSPIWRGGGRAFAARPRSFEQKVNKKMHSTAMRSILSELIRQSRMIVVDNFKLEQPKTKELVSKLKDLKLASVLILVHEMDEAIYLASRNIPNVQVLEVAHINPVKLLKFENVLATVDAVRKIEELLK
jgi:large subunit ribosomal protein L4